MEPKRSLRLSMRSSSAPSTRLRDSSSPRTCLTLKTVMMSVSKATSISSRRRCGNLSSSGMRKKQLNLSVALDTKLSLMPAKISRTSSCTISWLDAEGERLNSTLSSSSTSRELASSFEGAAVDADELESWLPLRRRERPPRPPLPPLLLPPTGAALAAGDAKPPSSSVRKRLMPRLPWLCTLHVTKRVVDSRSSMQRSRHLTSVSSMKLW
mmetsp:Transcript_11418/g.35268  ORF Transcript_11418/g.35268 Transcript_11418/m.35268 type:complete len:211 (-) Transcript_11418:309-941(-)